MSGTHDVGHPRPGVWTCGTCRWEWSYRPKTACPGLPRYGGWPRPTPGHLKTKTELAKAGKNPGGPPRGAVLQPVSNEYHKLYDEREAVAKRREISAAQAEALRRGREERDRRRRCLRCGERLTAKEARNRASSGGMCPGCRRQAVFEEARDGAVRWARGLLDSGGFVVFDCETTGLTDPEILEAAVVGPSGEVLFHSYLKPRLPVTPEARAVHRIPDERLETAPDLAGVHAELLALLAGRAIVCYNAPFDEGAWRASARRRGLPDQPLGDLARWEDAMEPYADFAGHPSPLPGGNHTALGDARATLALIRTMAAGDRT